MNSTYIFFLLFNFYIYFDFFKYNIIHILKNINKFLLFSFLSFFHLPLAATIILDLSLRLTHTFCYSSPLPTDFLSFSLYFSFFSLFLSLSLFFLTHSCSFFPSRDIYFHSSSLRTCCPSPSHLFVDVPLLHFYSNFTSSSSLFFSRHLVSLVRHPSSSFIFLFYFMFLFLCFILAYLSFFASRLMLFLARVSDLVAFALSFHPSLSLSLALSLYTAHSGGALPSLLAPLNYDRLAPFISHGVPTSSSSSSSSAPSASSVSLFFLFLSLSFSLA